MDNLTYISDCCKKPVTEYNDSSMQKWESRFRCQGCGIDAVLIEPEQQQVEVRCNHKFEFNMSGEAQCIYCLSFEQPDPTPSESEREIEEIRLFEDIHEIINSAENFNYGQDLTQFILSREEKLRSDLQQAKAENERAVDAIKKALLPENIECDGGCCTGCYKDILREYLKSLNKG